MSSSGNVRTVRVFVSSPGDIETERERVDLVAERLNEAFADRLRIETIRWERKFYSSHGGFQDQIPPAATADLVIAMFWARLGTPLPEVFARMESGERYPSGTAYEVLTAIDARKRGERPDVYVFRKTVPFTDQAAEAKAQWKDLNAFFSRWFQAPDGQFLRAYHRFQTPDEFEVQVEALLRHWIAERVPRDRSLIWPIETEGSPFRGLLPFDAKHAAVFFGRDRKVTRAIEQLQSVARPRSGIRSAPRNVPFLLIVGESGAGKSSLMRAGLAPRLTAPGMVPAVDLWRTAVVRIGDDASPFVTLAKALFVAKDEQGGFGSALPELRDGAVATPEQLAGLLAKGGQVGARKRAPAGAPILRALAKVQSTERVKRKTTRRLRANLLLLIDQLENIFAANVSDEECAAFARLVFALAATRRVWVVATIRSDMYPRLITPGDFLALKDAGEVYDLAAPGESELAEIVSKSAAAAGLVYETNETTGERLDERILSDAQGKNTLPLLQFALERLFEKRVTVRKETVDGQTGRGEVHEEIRLTFDAYAKIEGLGGAIDQTAKAALAKLRPAEIGALPRLLRCLAVHVHDKTSVTTGGSGLTVRMVPRAEAVPDQATARLVQALTEARIIVATGADGGATGDQDFIGIAHQRVFESWAEARKILAEAKDFIRIREEVENQRQRWEDKKRPGALLLAKGIPLAEGQQIVKKHGSELSPQVRAYVAASNRKAQRFNILMGATAAVFAVVAALAFNLKLAADRNFETAQANERQAAANFGVARETANNMIAGTAQGLRNLQGISVNTINIVLNALDKAIDTLKDSYSGNPLVDLSRASVSFEFAKTYQAVGDLVLAAEKADESLEIRSRITKYEQRNAAADAFEKTPGDWLWELSNSLELVGDLKRTAAGDAKISPDDRRRLLQEARNRFLAALELRERLAAASPDKDEWVVGRGLSYVRLGDLSVTEADPNTARERYQQSLHNAATYYFRRPFSRILQRELSWNFNKTGDLKRTEAEGKARNREPFDTFARDALQDYDNSLCLRRGLVVAEPNNVQFKRDVSFTVTRIGDVKRLLDDRAGAEANYYEAAIVSLRLYDNDANDVRYVDDVAFSMQKLGDFFRRSDVEKALAFYEYAADVRSRFFDSIANGGDARRKADAETKLGAMQRIVASARAELDPATLAALSPLWWRMRVLDDVDEFTTRAPVESNSAACLVAVMDAVKTIVGPSSTASFR